jgi:hypothetical protein
MSEQEPKLQRDDKLGELVEQIHADYHQDGVRLDDCRFHTRDEIDDIARGKATGLRRREPESGPRVA